MKTILCLLAALSLFGSGFFVARLIPRHPVAGQPEYTNSAAAELTYQTSAAVIGYGEAKIEDLEILRAANFDGMAALHKMGATDEGVAGISNKASQFFLEIYRAQHATNK
jgi:hypothetical protein